MSDLWMALDHRAESAECAVIDMVENSGNRGTGMLRNHLPQETTPLPAPGPLNTTAAEKCNDCNRFVEPRRRWTDVMRDDK